VPASRSLRPRIVAASTERTAGIVDALDGLTTEGLLAPCRLPDWSRLTIACHLRYGADALLRMTNAATFGKRVAYYPEGRAKQRRGTLEPVSGEHPHEVVRSLRALSTELDRLWSALDDRSWDLEIAEPADNPDLGSIRQSDLPLLRLTEVEVHGGDLDLGLDDWSSLFVESVLPTRLKRLAVRRANHREFDHSLEGSWLLVAVDGPTFMVSVAGDRVESHPAEPDSTARAVIEGTSRDLLAMLLGRPFVEAPQIRGDVTFGEAFPAAFPGP
jgi:uncharacterized protein (TIGR03083 family)